MLPQRSVVDDTPRRPAEAVDAAGLLHRGDCAQNNFELRVQRVLGLSQASSRVVEGSIERNAWRTEVVLTHRRGS